MNKAKESLKEGYTLVMCSDNIIHTSKDRGVKPLLHFVDNNIDVRGFSCADKVVGKGASFLYVLLGVKEVHACVLSNCAKDVLENNGIKITFDTLVTRIVNRTKNGFCPIEESVIDIDEPQAALLAIKNKLKELV